MIVPLSLALLLLFVAAYQLRFLVQRRKPTQTWQEILSQVEPLDVRGLQLIADRHLQPDAHQLSLQPSTMWELVGGMEGMKCLQRNSELLLKLAVIAERWNEVEGIIIAEMLRRDALRIRKAVRCIRVGMLWNGASVSAAFHLQEAVSSYCLMRGRLLGLYRNAHVALVPEFEAAM